jgi:hypothetical protein
MNGTNRRRVEVTNVFKSARVRCAGDLGLIRAEVQERRACLSKERFPEGAPGYD